MRYWVFLTVLCVQVLWGQKEVYPVFTIPENLTNNVNLVVRNSQTEITVQSQDRMTIRQRDIVTVFNETGYGQLDDSFVYSKNDKVKSTSAIVYDQMGKVLKKFGSKDFIDQVYNPSGNISDDRMVSFRYTPNSYPITVEWEYELETRNTAFIRPFIPVHAPYMGVEKASYKITAPAELGLEFYTRNWEGLEGFQQKEMANGYAFDLVHFSGFASESYAPRREAFLPEVLFRLRKFSLEGVKGEVSDWNSFGKWIYDEMLLKTSDVPPDLTQAIRHYVGEATDPMEKARKVYEFMQSRSRYVAIMLGIGGWKPMPVDKVYKMGYGDCKALSNFMRVLLKEVGVESYYTILHSDSEVRSLVPDFASVQGNHVILAIPQGDTYQFIECTSNTLPFGYHTSGNADRYVLVVKPSGGELVKTPKQHGNASVFTLNGQVRINADAGVEADFTTLNTGNYYRGRLGLSLQKESDRLETLRQELDQYRQLTITRYETADNRLAGEYTENITFKADRVGDVTAARMLLPIQLMYQSTDVPKRVRNRTMPVEIQSEFTVQQSYEVKLPEGYVLEAKPDNTHLQTPFGEYRLTIEVKDASTLHVQHVYALKKGTFPKESYEEYRKFREEVAKRDQSKIAIIKT